MHLYFYLRGNYPQVEIFKTMAQGLFWQWPRIDMKTGKEKVILVQGALRPSVIGTWEYVFPEQCLPEVLAVLGVTSSEDLGVSRGRKMAKARLATLRRIIGCKKIPKKIFEQAAKCPTSIKLDGSTRGLSHLKFPGVTPHVIGYKEDVTDEFFHDIEAPTGFIQEML